MAAPLSALNEAGFLDTSAWISGIVSSGTWNVGGRVLTEVMDLGTSAKDPPDKISYS